MKSSSVSTERRIAWIDMLKGIGILCVVLGHSTGDRYVYLFHMPLFYILSGYMIKQPIKPSAYISKSTIRLLIPYFSFLFLISLPEILHFLTNRGGNIPILQKLYGGYYLQGRFAVFWFITVLYVSLNLFNLILWNKWSSAWIFCLIFISSYIFILVPYPLPWNIQIVPFAISYIWIGFIAKDYWWKLVAFIDSHKLAASIIMIVSFIAIFPYRDSLYIDMKYSNYGIPLLSVIISIYMTCCLSYFCIYISRYKLPVTIFSLLGMASMIIMYLHQPIRSYFTDRYPALIDIISCTAISLVVFFVINRYSIFRMIFLA